MGEIDLWWWGEGGGGGTKIGLEESTGGGTFQGDSPRLPSRVNSAYSLSMKKTGDCCGAVGNVYINGYNGYNYGLYTSISG